MRHHFPNGNFIYLYMNRALSVRQRDDIIKMLTNKRTLGPAFTMLRNCDLKQCIFSRRMLSRYKQKLYGSIKQINWKCNSFLMLASTLKAIFYWHSINKIIILHYFFILSHAFVQFNSFCITNLILLALEADEQYRHKHKTPLNDNVFWCSLLCSR